LKKDSCGSQDQFDFIFWIFLSWTV
jgi:hypothetical protein